MQVHSPRPVYPSPAGLVTTVDAEGDPNIITLGEIYNASIREPVIVGIGIAPGRYSHQLIRQSGEFVVNLPRAAIFSTDNCKANRACIELLRAAFAGDFQQHVYGISQLSSTSPLYWEHGVLEAIMDTVPSGVPAAILPEPIAGFTAPFTLAGLVTMNNAECLSGLAMIQRSDQEHRPTRRTLSYCGPHTPLAAL